MIIFVEQLDAWGYDENSTHGGATSGHHLTKTCPLNLPDDRVRVVR